MTSIRHILRAALIVTAALSLLGCGRRGPLEPPNSAIATPAPTANSDLNEQFGRPKNPPITPPKTSFVLDPLL